MPILSQKKKKPDRCIIKTNKGTYLAVDTKRHSWRLTNHKYAATEELILTRCKVMFEM